LILSWREKIPTLTFLDACSPAAAVGYAIGRIGCLLSGDGDYGRPTQLPWGMSFPNGIDSTTPKCIAWGLPADCRVHPTPLYEFFVWMLIAWILWRIGAWVIANKRSAGLVFCGYLVLTGIARFLIEIIRLNPRSFFGMSNAQAASVASVLLGLALFFFFLPKQRRATA
jgi:phosphatidylglycerol:prolipoprotein diacylglycerol transferase